MFNTNLWPEILLATGTLGLLFIRPHDRVLIGGVVLLSLTLILISYMELEGPSGLLKSGILFSAILIAWGMVGPKGEAFGPSGAPPAEVYSLILFCTLGLLLLTSSSDLLSIYLSLELATLSLYILVSIDKQGQFSTEAGFKYFVLGALTTGVYLIGCVLIYYTTGSTNLVAITTLVGGGPLFSGEGLESAMVVAAFFILAALLFKLAAAPFHMWAPDVYEGAPTLITAFLAIVPKIAVLGLVIKFLTGPFFFVYSSLSSPLLFSALLSVIIGAFGALNQSKFKRLLAYSAIGHMGFILLGLTSNYEGIYASLIYFVIYVIMSINTFSLLLCLNSTNPYISQFSGISRTHGVLALTFAICLFSLAGIPPLAGFYSKLYILSTALSSHGPLIPLFVICISVIACFFYLRIIKFLYFKDSHSYLLKTLDNVVSTDNRILGGGEGSIDIKKGILLGASLYLMLTLLFFPEPLLKIIGDTLILSLI